MNSHDDQVERQFGPLAAAYLKSSVHAEGPDLRALDRKLARQSSLDALDLGCGAGHLTFSIAPYVRSVTAFDPSDDMLATVAQEARARRIGNICTRRGIAENLPFADQSFELVCTRYSAHHWANLPRALSEMRRVLSSTGRLIIIDVFAPELPLLDTHLQTLELLRDPSHVRNYSITEWRTQLARAGFQVTGAETWKLRLEFDAWVARSRTAADRVAILRSLLDNAPREVRDYLDVEANSTFHVNTVMLEASPLLPGNPSGD
jgi:ubiquinone/menaquinone biosynthesis C-methylase UbiE